MDELQKKIIAIFNEEWDNDEDYKKFEIVDDGEWTQDYKYQYRESIVKFEDRYYQISQSRSGSYHTDWYYDDPDICEVNKVEKQVVIISWEPVK